MLPKRIFAGNVGEAVREVIPYLEDTSSSAHKSIYFDGWSGLGAPAVLRAIAQHPPPSLMKKFSKIIHLDCSRWKSRTTLQRTIAQQLKLPQRVMAIFDRQDEEDDFRGVDESSRAEIAQVSGEILRFLLGYKCLVLFHNGSDNTVELTDFGIPQSLWFGTTVLWTFEGRPRFNEGIKKKVADSHFYLYCDTWGYTNWNCLLEEEAREIARYTCKLGVTPEIAQECCLYLFSLNYKGASIMDYNWDTHTPNYLVCDGIIQADSQFDEAWEVAATMHHQIQLKDYSSTTVPTGFADGLRTPKRWISTIMSFMTRKGDVTVPRESTSFFLVHEVHRTFEPPLGSLPDGMFDQSDMLRVLRLCRCTFSFSSPPFHCCRNLRFLGLDLCKDLSQGEDDERQIPEMDFFGSLWVVDICNTDWELTLSPKITTQMATNIREVHIKKGRFWHRNFAWGKLQNLRKLLVTKPTCPWEIQVLPNMSGATRLKTLVLDGCVGLEHVGPEGLPPSLESFSLHAGDGKDHKEEANISRISLAGCARLVNFRLCGSLPNLEELDLSGTSVKILDLKDQVVQAPGLQQIILLGCLQLHAILWPKQGCPKLTVLHIDSLLCRVQTDTHQAYATIMDMRFFQSLVLLNRGSDIFCWKSNKTFLNLCVSSTTKVKGQSYMKEKMGPGSSGQIMGPFQPKSSIIKSSYCTYTDVTIDNITFDQDYDSAPQYNPSGSCHVEIGEGISNTNVESVQGIKPIIVVMNTAESLHVHDNSSITTIIPQHMMSTEDANVAWLSTVIWGSLKQCCIERCPKMHTVFNTNYDIYCFHELETFWATDLLMAHCIWSKGRMDTSKNTRNFAKLRSIHLYCCPRLTFVLPMWWLYTLSSLETLRIVNCCDLTQVFPVEPEFLREIATDNPNGALEFPELKHIHLHDLHKLQQICEAKMFAPKLEKVRLRGCWGLKRLPAVGQDSRPVVDCEKDWWDKLEWDGLEVGHDPSLFEPHHSLYYKKPLPRVSVLR